LLELTGGCNGAQIAARQSLLELSLVESSLLGRMSGGRPRPVITGRDLRSA